MSNILVINILWCFLIFFIFILHRLAFFSNARFEWDTCGTDVRKYPDIVIE